MLWFNAVDFVSLKIADINMPTFTGQTIDL